jgi:hypothetical protein
MGMTRVAIGIRPHSGWAAIVVVSRNLHAVDVVARRIIAITAPDMKGAKQPYHFAQEQNLRDPESYLAECAAASERMALEGLRETIKEIKRPEKVVAGCAILLASGRTLPLLEKILASHPLIHTAEGEFFRQAFWRASELLGIQVTGIRERELDQNAVAVFGKDAAALQLEIAGLGKLIGPPWTADQKNACLAALLVLAA